MMLPFDRKEINGKKWWIAGAIYAVCAAAFIRDINDVDLIPYGIFYLPMVGTAVFYRDPRMVWVLAATAGAMVCVGYFLPVVSESAVESAINRVASLVAIAVTAGLLRYARKIQDALATQTLRAERGDQAKARLLTNLSRELVTPLNSIIGFSEMLQENCREDQQEFIGYVLDGGRGLLNTFRNLIDVTAGERRYLQAVSLDLRPVLDKVVRSALVEAARQRVCIELIIAGGALPDAKGDPWAVKRIVENLVSNAVKFNNPDGRVTVALAPDGDRVAVAVRDTGIGMAPDVVARLGELFFQAETSRSRKFEGMGAGLALSAQLARAMGGELQFGSAPGQGTTARLTLPAARDPGASAGNRGRVNASQA
jgi:signal transduction histidine kinase